MNSDVREKLADLSAALEVPATPKDIYDAEAIAALVNRFAADLLPDGPRHYDTAKSIVDAYARAVIADLSTDTGALGAVTGLKSAGPYLP